MRCTPAEADRLLTEVTGAFVDRGPIDWDALVNRHGGPAGRGALANLRLLDTFRRRAAPPGRPGRAPRGWVVRRTLLALAAVQTAGCLAMLALAFGTGDLVLYRPAQVALALAFTAAGGLMAAGTGGARGSHALLTAHLLTASAFARSAAAALPPGYQTPIAPLLVGLYPEAFLPAILWQFAGEFPRARRFTAFDVWARRLAIAAWVAGALLFAVNLVAAYGLGGDRLPVRLLRNHPAHAFWGVFALIALPALGAVLIRSRQAGWAERRRVGRFALALAVGVTPMLALGIGRLLWPRFDRWLVAASATERGWIDLLVLGATMSAPIACSIAVRLDRPFGARGTMTSRARGVRAGALSAAVVAMPLIALASLLYHRRHLPLGTALSDAGVLWSMALTLCAVLLFLSRAGMVTRPRPFNHQHHLARGLERVRHARGRREVSRVLTRELTAGTRATGATVLTAAGDGDFCDLTQSLSPLPAGAALVRLAREATEPLPIALGDPLHDLLPRSDRAWILDNEVALVTPLKRSGEALAGIVALGPRLDRRPFTEHDRWLAATLASAAAIAATEESALSPALRDEAGEEAAFECPACGLVGEPGRLPCGCRAAARLAALPRILHSAFRVERRLGRGAMGVVYLAHDTRLDRQVALKTLPDLHPRAAERLIAEARAMAAVDHEGLATLLGLEFWRRTPVLVVEFLPDGTLADRLRGGPLPVVEVLEISRRLAHALAHLHDHGILHRDLKPSNIGFTAAGGVKLLDFGLAVLSRAPAEKDSGEPLASAGRAVPVRPAGTPAYMSPEARRGSLPSAAADLWALSIVLLEALQQSDAPHLQAFFARALARRPEHRFQSAREMAAALMAIRPN